MTQQSMHEQIAPTVFIGWDPAEMMAHNIAAHSIRYNTVLPLDIRRLALAELQAKGMYTRETQHRALPPKLWDVVSEAPMSTEHAISRFFVPWYMNYKGWALFVDGDVLCRQDLVDLFDHADAKYAVMVVQHAADLQATEGKKKNGMIQLPYVRKNWSSVMLWNCAHLANRSLNAQLLNHTPGRDLHRFCWLDDSEIGALPPEWNYLVNVSSEHPDTAAIAHFTLGTPNLQPSGTALDSEWYRYGRMAGYGDEKLLHHSQVAAVGPKADR